VPLKDLSSLLRLEDKPFIKIAKKIPLAEWTHAGTFFVKTYGELLKMLED
jgi:hypothetical protein